MKKITAIFMSIMLVFCFTACTGNQQSESSTQETTKISEATEAETKSESETNSQAHSSAESETQKAESGKTLIAYFSWSSSGNTEKMAKTIAEQTGGEIYEITPKNPYPEDYTECTEVAKVEADNNSRPEIKNLPESVEEYDRIIIGYPIWWHTAPMIIGTFLESYDLTGVDVYPFSQSSSMDEEQFNESMEFVRTSAKDANVHDGLFTSPTDVDTITDYLEQNGLIKKFIEVRIFYARTNFRK